MTPIDGDVSIIQSAAASVSCPFGDLAMEFVADGVETGGSKNVVSVPQFIASTIPVLGAVIETLSLPTASPPDPPIVELLS